jgi:uncharacterized protein (DUF952 family)
VTEKPIFHICRRQDWIEAQETGEYQADSFRTEGFIHCSNLRQIAGVANNFYSNVPDLILLKIDVEKLIPEVKYEAADGQIFPHIYGPLNLDAVGEVFDFEKKETGLFEDPIV